MAAQRTPSPEPYRSLEARRHYIIVVAFVIMLTFLLITLLPQALESALGIEQSREELTTVALMRPGTAVRWRDAVWAVEVLVNREAEPARNRPIRIAGEEVEFPFQLPPGRPWLLPQKGRLLTLSSHDGVAEYDGEVLHSLKVPPPPDGFAHPFLLDGRPAVVAPGDEQFRILALKDSKWTDVASAGVPVPDQETRAGVQAVVADGKPYLFAQQGDTLYMHHGFPEKETAFPADWQRVTGLESLWHAAAQGSGLRVAFYELVNDVEPRLTQLAWDGEEWREAGSQPVGLPPQSLSLVPDGRGGALAVLQSVPWMLLMISPEGEAGPRVVATLPDGRRVALYAALMVGTPYLLVLCLSRGITELMRRFRTGLLQTPAGAATLAAPHRRFLARLLDSLIMLLPVLVALLLMLGVLAAYARADFKSLPLWTMAATTVFFAGLAWLGGALFAFSFMEGRWGCSPGKLLFGLRVTGLDLRPCGFFRAFGRMLLLFVDLFISALVALTLIALTRHRQRFGDLMMNCVVIEAQSGAPTFADAVRAAEAELPEERA